MRISVLMLLLLTLFALTACSGQERLHFYGASANWEVNYDLEVSVKDNSQQGTIKINYVGEEEAPNQIDYDIKGASSGLSGDDAMLEDGFLETPGSNCSGCAVTQEDDEFDVTIDWNDNTENVTLKNEQ